MKSSSLALCVLFALTLVCKVSAKRPNILFVFSDDHATHAIGAYNGWLENVNPTPNIDALARQGMLFENSFCTNSICGPSRAVIMSGKHSHKNGFRQNGDTFDWGQQIFPKLLQSAGYATAIFGKSHLRGDPQGFDDWWVLPGQGQYYNPDLRSVDGTRRFEGHCTDIVTELAVDWLRNKRDADKPFMLMVQHKAPHRNWMPAVRHLDLYDDIEIPYPETLFDKWQDNASPARYQEMEIDRHMHMRYDLFVDLMKGEPQGNDSGPLDKSAWRNTQRMSAAQIDAWRGAYPPKDDDLRRRNLGGDDLIRWKFQRYAKNYLRCVKGVDESVGTLVETLEQLGLSEDTIVIYSSDQGFYIGDHGWYDKRWMYEESLKMPFIVKWPGVTAPGSRCQELIQNLDYAETFLDIADVAIPDDMQGASLEPLLRGETPDDWRDSIYYHYYEYPGYHMVPKHYGIRTQTQKLIRFYQHDEWEFYDLASDPDELNNAYADPKYADAIAALKVQLQQLRDRYEDDSEITVMPEAWREKMRQRSPYP